MALSRFIAVFSEVSSNLHNIAHVISPQIQLCPPDGLIFEVPVRYEQDTLNRLNQVIDPSARIGGASTRTAAIFAAKVRPGTIVPHGKEVAFLASLPIGLISIYAEVDDRLLETLTRWGIKTFGELATLPKTAVASRFGPRGLLLQKMARGEDTELFDSYRQQVVFEQSRELEWVLDSLEPLTFILGGMLEELCNQLTSHGLAVDTVQLTLKLVDNKPYQRSLKLALPMQDHRSILSLLRIDLQSNPPRSGVISLRIQVQPANPRIVQHSLFQPATPHPEKLSRTLTRLKALVGEENVGCPQVLNTHRPDAIQMGNLNLATNSKASRGKKIIGKSTFTTSEPGRIFPPLLSLRRLRPPQITKLQGERILSCSGPWRSSGDWWQEKSEASGWSREEWDVEFVDGGICRVYWDHVERQWFLEGIYD